MTRYHGFTCPNCGSHMFGTYTHHRAMGDKFPHGTKVGRCNEHGHTGNGCEFRWNRDDPIEEAKCMYEQTHEEFEANFEKTLSMFEPKKTPVEK